MGVQQGDDLRNREARASGRATVGDLHNRAVVVSCLPRAELCHALQNLLKVCAKCGGVKPLFSEKFPTGVFSFGYAIADQDNARSGVKSRDAGSVFSVAEESDGKIGRFKARQSRIGT
jgi:hypothetical protein